MIGYKDRTWCPLKFNLRCSRSQGCYRAFTEQDQIHAERWWGGKGFPIAYFLTEPECFIPISINPPDGKK